MRLHRKLQQACCYRCCDERSVMTVDVMMSQVRADLLNRITTHPVRWPQLVWSLAGTLRRDNYCQRAMTVERTCAAHCSKWPLYVTDTWHDVISIYPHTSHVIDILPFTAPLHNVVFYRRHSADWKDGALNEKNIHISYNWNVYF